MKKLLLMVLISFTLMAENEVNAEVISDEGSEYVNMEIMDYKNPFVKSEEFPRDYLLVIRNLPQLMKIIISEPTEIYFKPSQIAEITKGHTEYYNKIFPNAAKTKHKELELTYAIVNEKKSFADVEILLHEIAQLRIENTKYEIELLNKIQSVLNDGQYKKLLDIAKRWTK